MENIIKSREILDSVKTELIKLQQKIAELSKFDSSQSFIPVDLCTSTAMTLEKLSAYEESLFEKIAAFSETVAATIPDAEAILKQAETEAERKLLKKKLDGLKSGNPNYDGMLEQLKIAAVCGNDAAPERIIAELLISDLLNNTCETSKNEQVENSEYYRLAFALNRKELYYETSDQPSGGENVNSDHDGESDDTPSVSEEPADEEPPPTPYSAKKNKNEVFLDIDLERDEDFIEDQTIDLSFSPEFESIDTIDDAQPIGDTEENTDVQNADDTPADYSQSKPEAESEPDSDPAPENEPEPEAESENAAEAPGKIEQNQSELQILSADSEMISIIEEYRDSFEDNPTKRSLEISQSPEVATKHNVTEIINMLSPKGRNARSPVKVFHVLMTELLLYGPKTEDDLYELPDFLKNRISNTIVDGYLQKLYNKGLISRINYDGNILYYFTQKGLKFNSHDRMISNFYCTDKRSRSSITKRDCRKVYPVSCISVCASVILSKIVKKYPYYLAIGSADIAVEGLGISVISKPNIRNFAVAYVSDNSANLDKLYENLKRSLQALRVFEKIDTMIIGSFTGIQAEAVYKVVKKTWSEKLVSTKIALYSYAEDKYFIPETFEEFTDFENIDEPEPQQNTLPDESPAESAAPLDEALVNDAEPSDKETPDVNTTISDEAETEEVSES